METETRSMDNLADLLDPPGFRDPSKPHVTDLIYAADAIGSGKEIVPFDYDALPEYSRNIMSMGRIWEHLVGADVIREACLQGLVPIMKPVMEVDGILGSVDGALYPVDRLTQAEVVVEIKARFSPPKPDFPMGNTKYMRQCKAYCHMTGARKVWMPILYFNTRPPNAQYLIHRFEFTDLEVEENWQMILNIRDFLNK